MSVAIGSPAVIGLIAVLYMLSIFLVLSRRLGAVTKMKPYYRGLYVAVGLVTIAVFFYFLRTTSLLNSLALPEILNSELFYVFAYYLPLALAATIGLVVVWKYWSWLFREQK